MTPRKMQTTVMEDKTENHPFGPWAPTTVLDQAGEAFVITNAEGRITYVNEAFERMTGYSREEAIGQQPSILKSGRQDEAFYRELWQTIAKGSRWHGRFINRRKDGSLYEQWATIAPIREPGGAIGGYVAVQMDMTHQLDLERRLAQAERLASVGEAIAGAAHTIKNIMNTINGSARLIESLLGNTADCENLKQLWEVHQRSTARLNHLARQMLDYVRDGQPAQEPLALNELALEVLESCRAGAEASHVRLTLEPDEGLPRAPGDRTALHDALLNLVANAIEAAAERKDGRVTIATRALINEIELTVEDNGAGIPPEARKRLFQPFYTTKGHKGNGLGLATVHKTVEAHRGAIEVESEPGRTCFKIRLPL